MGSLLYREESSNSLMIGLCESMLTTLPKISPIFIRIVKDHETISAAVQTPPMNLVITYSDQQALKELAEYLKASHADFPAVVGPAKEAEYFANQWSKVSNKHNRLAMAQKIYKLEKVLFPKAVEGSFQVASSDHLELVSNWIMAFEKSRCQLLISEVKFIGRHMRKVLFKNRQLIFGSKAINLFLWLSPVVQRKVVFRSTVFTVHQSLGEMGMPLRWSLI